VHRAGARNWSDVFKMCLDARDRDAAAPAGKAGDRASIGERGTGCKVRRRSRSSHSSPAGTPSTRGWRHAPPAS
jgi:hypothetical protein